MPASLPSPFPPSPVEAPKPWVRLLVTEPDLGASIAEDDLATARRIVIAPTETVAPGIWEGTTAVDDAFAAVVLDGLLTRECRLAGRCSTHIVGAGDVIPLGEAPAAGAVGQLSWRATMPTRIAVLDRRFVAAVARWPWLVADIVRRTASWAERAAVLQGIAQLPRVEDRLLALLWHLADHWGRVGSDGVVLPLKLSHEALGTLVGARRPTVSLALAELRGRDVVRAGHGGFVLHPDGRALLERPPSLERPATIAVLPHSRSAADGPGPGAMGRARAARDAATATRRQAAEQRQRARAMRDLAAG
jgi:CRP/FNR family transcriptional regulator, cyclic AMP receptor protein